MKSKQLMFFGVLEDFAAIFHNISVEHNLHFYKAGMLDSEHIPYYSSVMDLPDLGATDEGDWNRIDRYIVMTSDDKLSVRRVPQRSGDVRFAVDQMQNQDSIELKLGGQYSARDNVLIAGRLGTISNSRTSTDLFKIFSSRLKRGFRKIDAYYVGPEAEKKMNAGWRLVTNEKSPEAFDLKNT